MSNGTQIQGKIVKEYLKDWPDIPNTTLAKKIYSEDDNHRVFKSVDNVRSTIRYYKGQKGDYSRASILDKSFFTYDKGEGEFNLPKSDAFEYRQISLPKECKNILLLSDIHIPYQDNNVLELALKYGKENKVDTIYLNGDTMDCHCISRFMSDPKARDMNEELQMVRQFLFQIREAFPDAKIYYKLGNHEDRWESYMKTKAPELLDINDFHLNVLLKFHELNITLIESKQIVKAGKLYLLHGHEKPASGVNPSRSMSLKYRQSSIMGHVHRTSEYFQSNLDADTFGFWSTGCLCELSPEYGRLGFLDWNHGFAHILVNSDGTFDVDNKRILKGKVL